MNLIRESAFRVPLKIRMGQLSSFLLLNITKTLARTAYEVVKD
jgi:hypothetical protein